MKKTPLILIFLCSWVTLFAQTKQIRDLQEQQKILREDIKNTNKLYIDVKKQTSTIVRRIQLLNKQIDSRKEVMALQQKEIAALDKELKEKEHEIERLAKDLNLKQKSYAKAIKSMLYNKQSENNLFFVLSGKSWGESLRRMQYLRDYSKWRKSQAEEIKKQNAEIKKKKEALEKTKSEREKALLTLQAEQKKLKEEEQNKQKEMLTAKGKQQKLQKALQDKQQRINRLNAQIEKLIAEEVARQEREAEARRRAESERKRKAEEAAKAKRAKEKAKDKKGKEQTTEEPRRDTPKPSIEVTDDAIASASFNLSENFAANKGRLPMPVTGSATIVGNFGINKHKEWNVSTKSNGIDIQAQRGANIRAIFDGEVSKIFSFPGSNTCIIIRHGEYYTFYANVFDLYVRQGDKIKTGQSLGRIYTDPDTGLSTMHFQLWRKTTKLNPTPWLKR